MLKGLPFGAWTPDLAPNGTDGLAELVNAYPIANGYGPVGLFQAMTPALTEAFGGGGAFIGSDGTTALLAGTANKLLRYSGSAWSVLLTALSVDRWRFTQFGDLVIAVNGGAPQKFNVLTGAGSALGGNPPASAYAATVRDFVVLAGDPSERLTVSWSGFNNAEQYTVGTNQSDQQVLPEGGEVMGLVGGEYGLVFQRSSIKRMSYTGGPTIFQFDEIARDVGLMVPGALASWGRMAFFLSERGFMICDGNEVRPIGAEKVDRTFFRTHSREDLKRLYCAIDPRSTVVMWALPGSPGTVWAYNWTLDRWAMLRLGVAGLFTGFTANTSIDALDGTYGNLDAIPVSLDDPAFAGGNPLLLVVDPQNRVGTMGGAPMEARFGLPSVELSAARRSRLRRIQPIGDVRAAKVSVDGRQRLGDAQRQAATADLRPSGRMPIRLNARYMAPTLTIPAGERWSYAQGLEVEYEPGARR